MAENSEKSIEDLIVADIEIDIGRHNIARYVCPLDKVVYVVEAVVLNPNFHSLRVRFAGSDDAGNRVVEVEVTYSVPLDKEAF